MGNVFAKRTIPVIAGVLLVVGVLAGCSASGTPGDGATSVAARGALDPGFLGGVVAPSPEATINPSPGSWDDVAPHPGYRVVLISAEGDAAAEPLQVATTRWASEVGATVDTRVAADDDQVEVLIGEAEAEDPDLIVGAGAGVVDVFSLMTAQYLEQQFLVIGAQLPEPTGNVTSVIWDGASFRGTGISTADDTADADVSAQHATDAISAGVASVLHGYTGIVVRLP